jgi:hypothetical protein
METIPNYLTKQEGYGFEAKIYLLAPEKWKTGLQLYFQSHERIPGLPLPKYEYIGPNTVDHEKSDKSILDTVQMPQFKILALMIRMLNRNYKKEFTEWSERESTGAFFGYFLFDEIALMYQYIKSITPGDYFKDEQRWYPFEHPSDLMLKKLRDVNIILSNFWQLANGWRELCLLCGYNYENNFSITEEVFRLAKKLRAMKDPSDLYNAFKDAIDNTRKLPMEYPSPSSEQLKLIYEIGSKPLSVEIAVQAARFKSELKELQRDASGICQLYENVFPLSHNNTIWCYLLFNQMLSDLTDKFKLEDIMKYDSKVVGWDNKGHVYIAEIPYQLKKEYITSDRCTKITDLNPIVTEEFYIMQRFFSNTSGSISRDVSGIISRIISTTVKKGSLNLDDYVKRTKTNDDVPLYQDMINRELSVFYFYCDSLRERSENWTKSYEDWGWDKHGHSPNEAKEIYENAKSISETQAPWLLTDAEFEIYMNTVAPKPRKREKAIFEHLSDFDWNLLNIQSDKYYDMWRSNVTLHKKSLKQYPIGMPMEIIVDGKKTSAVNFYPNTGLWNYDTDDEIQKKNASFWSRAADFLRHPWETLTGETFIDFIKNTLLKVIYAIIEVLKKAFEAIDPLLPTILKYGAIVALGFIGYHYIDKKVVG